MNKIKDLIYNSSDILIAILILVLAAVIILWRLGIILEYPKEIIGTENTENVLTEPTGDEEAAEGEAASEEATSAEGETAEATQGETSEATQGEAAEGGDAQAGETQGEATEEGSDKEAVDTSKAVWDGDALAQTLDVYITGTTATATVQCLVDAGAFKDYAEYASICKEMGYDDEKMRAGDFSFEKGSTKKDIIKQVNYSG